MGITEIGGLTTFIRDPSLNLASTKGSNSVTRLPAEDNILSTKERSWSLL